jgi:phosphate transport system substrate-binding protein
MTLTALLVASASAAACSSQPATGGNNQAPAAAATAKGSDDSAPQTIVIDGSSTVYPITEAVAEEFQKGRKARVTIGVSGTGGGFKKFCRQETAITGASRPIKPTEVELCKASGVEYIELPVAYDGIAVVANPKASWVTDITVEELKKMWEPAAQGKVMKWSQIRDGWPDREIHLFGPGIDSGTYDYFTKAIVGKEHSSRGDFTSSEDDNVLVQGVANDPGGLGFFGFAYYAENKDQLKLLTVDDGKDDNGKGPIAPSLQTVGDGTYQPLSRPVFVYVNKKAAQGEGVRSFVEFYLTEGTKLVEEVGYIPLPAKIMTLVAKRFREGTAGTVFGGTGSKVGMTIEELLAGQQ